VRFKKYLIEDRQSESEVIQLIRKNCSEALNAMSQAKYVLWRGTNRTLNGLIGEFTPRIDRKPRDTNKWLHDVLDKEFRKEFGWGVRSEGIFATTARNQADAFGNYTYLFFPFDGFKFVWSDDITDLTNALFSFNYDLSDEKLVNERWLLYKYAKDEYIDLISPDYKTGGGRGYWETDNTYPPRKFRDFQEIFDYYGPETKIGRIDMPYEQFVLDFITPDGLKVSAVWYEVVTTSDLMKLVGVARKNFIKAAEEYIEYSIIPKYRDDGLKAALYSRSEISFKCSKYYMVDDVMFNFGLKELIYGD